MFIDDLFGKYRKTEPTRLLLLRAFIVIVLVAGLTGYITALIIEIANETPTVKVTSTVEDNLPIPDAILTMTSAFTISCAIKKNDGSTENCDGSLSQPVEKNGKYYGSFKGNNEYYFIPKRKDPSAILSFEFTLTASNYDGNNGEVTLIDPEKNPINVELASEVTDEMLQTLDVTTQEILRTNLYYLANNARTNIKFSRNIKETIKKKFTDILGASTELERRPFITSNLQYLPLTTGSSSNYMGIVVVEPQNYIVETKTEIRQRTILTALGVMGGACDTIRPFGCVQCLPCIKSASRKKLRDRLRIIPLVDEKYNFQNTDDVKLRIDALEVFLREYVVDAGVLNEMAKSETPSQTQYTYS
ncbi:7058_t:CDS:10 [Diversispora eburnea]|uniref:7058_t:CDS:1 n=1 Tax=Diversispora eburnea TaxID=1213867 RepID=A0A9N8UZA8_9GLOM|nr:7058_t:CDS:10 [Diversispora eburnea]